MREGLSQAKSREWTEIVMSYAPDYGCWESEGHC